MRKPFVAAVLAAFALSLAACDHEEDASARAFEVAVAKEILAPKQDPDKLLAEKVRDALGIGQGPAYGIEVTADEGRVILLGHVDSNAERKRFEVTAAGVVGVRAIDNRIVVDPGT
ncbi:MAG: BON domain-containing protein [Burkholderiales bacterium]